jgi:hypothetical protein
MILSADGSQIMGVRITEGDLAIYVYPTSLIHERIRQRNRLEYEFSTLSNIEMQPGSSSRIWGKQVFQRRCLVATLHRKVSVKKQKQWFLECVNHRLFMGLHTETQSYENNSNIIELSTGEGLLSWTAVSGSFRPLLGDLWEKLQPTPFFLRVMSTTKSGMFCASQQVKVLGFRKNKRTFQAFLMTR